MRAPQFKIWSNLQFLGSAERHHVPIIISVKFGVKENTTRSLSYSLFVGKFHSETEYVMCSSVPNLRSIVASASRKTTNFDRISILGLLNPLTPFADYDQILACKSKLMYELLFHAVFYLDRYILLTLRGE